MISTRLRITFFFTLLTFVTLTLFSSSVLFLYHQYWEENEKSELHDTANNFFVKVEEYTALLDSNTYWSVFESDVHYFFDTQENLMGKIWNNNNQVIFESPLFPNYPDLEIDEYFVDIENEYIFYKRRLPHLNGEILFVENIETYIEQEHMLIKISILLTLCGVLILWCLGYLFAWKILSPLREISRKTISISLDDLTHRLPVIGHKTDEMRVLSENLNNMFTRLEIAARNLHLFTQDASHELKTPLSIIDSSLQLAIKTKNFEKIQESHEEMKKIHEILDALLLLAKNNNFLFLDSQKTNIHLFDYITNILKKISLHFSQKNITFHCDIPNDATFFVEENSFERIIWNLLWNAFKFSPHNETIDISFSDHSLFIKNKGYIDEEDMAHLFIPFFRCDRSKSLDGNGLGLAIVKNFVDANNGVILVKHFDGMVIFELFFKK